MRIIGWIATALLVAGGLACGGSDETAVRAAPAQVDRPTTSAANRAPVIRSVRLDPATPSAGDRVNALVAVEDKDGDPIELVFTWRISGRVVPNGEAYLDLKSVTKHDQIEVEVKASDGKLSSEAVKAGAQIQNRRPVVVGIAVSPQPEVLPGETLVATAQAQDPDGDPVEYSYRWRVNAELQTHTGDSFETDGLVKGDEIQAIAVASDGAINSDELASVVVRVANAHPEIVSVPEGVWTNDGFSYAVEARDPDNDVPLRYALKTGPTGMRVDSVLGRVFWQPTSDQTGVHPIEIAVSDALGATSVQIFEITVKTEGGDATAPPASARR